MAERRLRAVGRTEGDVVPHVASIRDALSHGDDRFRVIVEELEAIVFVKDEATQIAFVSGFAETILGYPAERLAEHGFWRSLVIPEDRAATYEAWDVRQDHYDLEYRVRAADGRIVWLRERMHPAYRPDGRVETWYGIAFDVTDRKRLEEDVLRVQRLDALGRMASAVAHDFDNVLYGISIFAGYLQRGIAADDGAREELDQIVAAVERGRRLTRQLLAFSRGQSVSPVRIDAAEVVRDLVPMVARLLGERVTIVPLLARTAPVLADRSQLEQIVLNLATNARDAMPDGGTLALGLSIRELAEREAEGFESLSRYAGERVVELAVSDTGIGMDEATRTRIFEPFFSTKPVDTGTGLGLSTVYGLVRSLGGAVMVESEPGAGSTFRILLPLLADDADAADAAASDRASAAARERLPLRDGDSPHEEERGR